MGVDTQSLWAHQTQAIERAERQRDLALFMDPGVGKTACTIYILRNKYNAAKRIRRTLILGPSIVVGQWRREFEKFSKIPQEKIICLTGSGKKRLADFNRACGQFPQGFIVVTNYEALLMEDLYEALLEWEPEIFTGDESHRFKAHDTKRFKLLRPLTDKCAHRYILTGSPVLNSPADIWAQLRILNRGESFMLFNPRTNRQEPMSFHQWQRAYFYDRNAGMPKHAYFPDWQVKPASMVEFSRVLASLAIQAKRDECMDLPELLNVVIPVELGRDQRRAYEEMRQFYVAMVKDQAITASLAITQSLRLRQILAGFVQPDLETPATFFEDNPRMEAMKSKVADLVEQGQKVIIWTNFVPTYDKIAQELKKLRIPSGFLTGRETAKEKDATVLQFTKGDLPVAVCNPAAVGLGVNLTESKASVYYDRSYSREHQIQTLARNYRGGSEMHDCITHYDLVSTGTMDEIVAEALLGKGNISEALLAWANQS